MLLTIRNLITFVGIFLHTIEGIKRRKGEVKKWINYGLGTLSSICEKDLERFIVREEERTRFYHVPCT